MDLKLNHGIIIALAIFIIYKFTIKKINPIEIIVGIVIGVLIALVIKKRQTK